MIFCVFPEGLNSPYRGGHLVVSRFWLKVWVWRAGVLWLCKQMWIKNDYVYNTGGLFLHGERRMSGINTCLTETWGQFWTIRFCLWVSYWVIRKSHWRLKVARIQKCFWYQNMNFYWTSSCFSSSVSAGWAWMSWHFCKPSQSCKEGLRFLVHTPLAVTIYNRPSHGKDDEESGRKYASKRKFKIKVQEFKLLWIKQRTNEQNISSWIELLISGESFNRRVRAGERSEYQAWVFILVWQVLE